MLLPWSIQFIVIINIQIQMKKLAYIPTITDKQKLYAEIESLNQPPKDSTKVVEPISHEQQMSDKKKLSKQQLAHLLKRLTQNTKKEYNTQQQTTHILAVNLVINQQYQELKRRREEGDKVQNRLLEYGKRKQQKKEELARELEAENKQKYYREVPQISNKAKNMNQKAIDKRLSELIDKRISKRQQLLEKYQPTFRPVINPQSDFIIDLENYGDFHNRMEVRQKEANKRKEELIKAIQEKKKQENTFKPIINTNSKNIAENLPERKALSVATPKHKDSTQSAKEINREIYPFAPTINKNTENLISKKGPIFETDCFRRLYNNAKEMVVKHQDKIQQRNRAYTFQPELNNHSLKLAATLHKRPKQQTLKQFSQKGSEEQYQQIKIGNTVTDYSRKKTYSVRNTRQSSKEWQQSLKQKCVNVLHRGGKIATSLIR